MSGFELKSKHQEDTQKKDEKKRSRIAFRRNLPEPVDFDDVEERIIGTVNRRKKNFVTAKAQQTKMAKKQQPKNLMNLFGRGRAKESSTQEEKNKEAIKVNTLTSNSR